MIRLKDMMFVIESFTFLLSSALTLLLIYKGVSIILLQQITIVILLILILFSRFLFSENTSNLAKLLRLLTLFLSSFLIQIFIFSTGGFYSPFLILLHLYTLGSSFLLNLQSGIIFLIFAVSALVVSSVISLDVLNIFQNDPGTGAIYIVSFVVIIPLAQLLVKNYQLKDTLSKILGKYLKIGESREKSILRNLNELVIVTDSKLQIISINNAVEKAIRVSSDEITGQNFLKAIPLRDLLGNPLTEDKLSVDKAVINKATYYLQDIYLTTAFKQFGKIVIQVTPIIDEEGKTDQIVFVITDAKLSSEVIKHPNLEKALIRHKEIGLNLKNSLNRVNLASLASLATQFSKTEEDLITMIEIEDHPIKQLVALTDVAALCKEIIDSRKEFAASYKVPIRFELPEGSEKELAKISMGQRSNIPVAATGVSDFAAPIDRKWLNLLVQKLTDLAILLSSSGQNPGIVISLKKNDNEVDTVIKLNAPAILQKEIQNIFVPYYGSLAGATNLRMGSGLEGFIAKVISEEIDIVIGVDYQTITSSLIFTIKLYKTPH